MELEKQVEMIKKVKRFNNGFINEPIIVSPKHTLSDIFDLIKETGYTGFPVTLDGTRDSKLVGMITKRDIDFVELKTQKLIFGCFSYFELRSRFKRLSRYLYFLFNYIFWFFYL